MFTELQHKLKSVLQQLPECTEYQLHQQLATELQTIVPDNITDFQHKLFYKHFALFHCLYQIRFQWLQQGHVILDISPLHIEQHPYCPSISDIVNYDPLVDFYCNIDNLQQTSASTLHQWLDNFWQRLKQNPQQQESLAFFNFSQLPTLPQLKRRYRQLALQHHPDRAGHLTSIQHINRMYQQLKPYCSDTQPHPIR